MKKTITIILALALLCSLVFVGCKEENAAPVGDFTVSLNKSTVNMEVFSTLELTAKVVDAGTGNPVAAQIIWESTDPTVAEVTDGRVVAKAQGQTDIIAALETGESATCKITVENTGIIPQLVISGVSDNKLTVAKGQSFHLTGMVTLGGKDCTEEDTTFTFRVADAQIATVSADGVLQAVNPGTTQVIITATWRGMGGESMTGGQDAYGLQVLIDLTVAQN